MKIPLEDTIGGTYRFLFSNVLSIIGTVWLPFLLAALIIGGLAYLILPPLIWQGDFEHFDQATILALVPPVLALYPIVLAVTLVTSSMIAVGLLERSLGWKTAPTFVYFSLGAPVWRMLGARIVLVLIMILVGCLCAAVSLATVFAAQAFIPRQGWQVLLDGVVIIAAVCAYIYIAVRLMFFLPAVVVAEAHIGITRSWQLGAGNFWRIVVIALIIVIPVGFVAGIVNQIFAFGALNHLAAQMQQTAEPTPAEVSAMLHALLRALWPAILINVVFQSVAGSGLWYGAVGYAYRAVTAAAPASSEG